MSTFIYVSGLSRERAFDPYDDSRSMPDSADGRAGYGGSDPGREAYLRQWYGQEGGTPPMPNILGQPAGGIRPQSAQMFGFPATDASTQGMQSGDPNAQIPGVTGGIPAAAFAGSGLQAVGAAGAAGLMAPGMIPTMYGMLPMWGPRMMGPGLVPVITPQGIALVPQVRPPRGGGRGGRGPRQGPPRGANSTQPRMPGQNPASVPPTGQGQPQSTTPSQHTGVGDGNVEGHGVSGQDGSTVPVKFVETSGCTKIISQTTSPNDKNVTIRTIRVFICYMCQKKFETNELIEHFKEAHDGFSAMSELELTRETGKCKTCLVEKDLKTGEIRDDEILGNK